MRFSLPLSLAGLATSAAFVLAGAAHAHQSLRPDQPKAVNAMRSLVSHYRSVTWTFERAAHMARTPSSFSDRHTTDRAYLQWLIDRWTARAYVARDRAIAAIHRRLRVSLPDAPGLHARLARRVAFERRLTIRLREIYPGRVPRSFASAHRRSPTGTLRLWQERSAVAALAVAVHAVARAAMPPWLSDAFLCIHSYEGAWNANTGNGYFGGLQMDRAFQRLYGGDFFVRWGTADRWPPWAQIAVAARAYESGRGFSPWPRTARACGLL